MPLVTGIKHKNKMIIDETKTAIAAKSGTLPVFATPYVAALMEQTAEESVRPYIEDGQATVGTKLILNHTAATVAGKEVSCESELVEIDRRRLVFRITASDNAGQVADCEHERFIIDIEKFMAKAKERGED
ncbi:MAG: thioesterase family protein [Clostridia bacterium]|nr:thioesterase family protein [Clostridia bacterium]